MHQKKLFELFEKKVISISGFASLAGISRSLLNQYIRGKKKLSESQKNKILIGFESLKEKLPTM